MDKAINPVTTLRTILTWFCSEQCPQNRTKPETNDENGQHNTHLTLLSTVSLKTGQHQKQTMTTINTILTWLCSAQCPSEPDSPSARDLRAQIRTCCTSKAAGQPSSDERGRGTCCVASLGRGPECQEEACEWPECLCHPGRGASDVWDAS